MTTPDAHAENPHREPQPERRPVSQKTNRSADRGRIPALCTTPPPPSPQPGASEGSSGVRSMVPWIVPALAIAVGATWLAGARGLGGDTARAVGLWFVILSSVWLPLVWMTAAWGYGAWTLAAVARLARPSPPSDRPSDDVADRSAPPLDHRQHALTFGTGAALLLWLDHALGAAGLLQAAGGAVAWGLIVIGVLAAVLRAVRVRRSSAPVPVPRRSSVRGVEAIESLRTVTLARSTGGVLFIAVGAVLLAAAASAPGWLWDSEAAGYDALSYHLQLPKEWLDAGRVQGFAHNVYSFLPSYVEAAYYHLAILTRTFDSHASGGAAVVAAPAVRMAYACQLLHLMFAATAGLAMWDLMRRLAGAARRAQPGRSPATAACDTEIGSAHARGPAFAAGGLIAAATVVSVPWMTVVASLAYNEAAVVLLFITALAIAIDFGRVRSSWRAVAVLGGLFGFVLGVALGAKLTAFGFVAIPAGLVAVGRIAFGRSRGDVARFKVLAVSLLVFLISGAMGGLVALAPYAVRNHVDTGRLIAELSNAGATDIGDTANPVFPFATEHFGTAHWTTEQAERWAAAHDPEVSSASGLIGRFVDMVLLHSQWAGVWLAAALAAMALLYVGMRRHRAMLPTSRLTVELLLMLVVQLIFWGFFTHQQSRFLIPALVPLSMLLGLVFACSTTGSLRTRIADADTAAATAGPKKTQRAEHQRTPAAGNPGVLITTPRPPSHRRILTMVLVSLFVLWLGIASLLNYAHQRNGQPSVQIDALELRTGAIARSIGTESGRREFFQQVPAAMVNVGLPAVAAGDRPDLYLLGGATPYYLMRPLVWHTTWDRSPIGDLIEAHPDDPAAWARALRDDLGVRYILIDFGELNRLIDKDGWYDPRVSVEDVLRLTAVGVGNHLAHESDRGNERDSSTAADIRVEHLMSWPAPPAMPIRVLYQVR